MSHKVEPKERPQTATLPSVFGYDADTYNDYPDRPGQQRNIKGTRLA